MKLANVVTAKPLSTRSMEASPDAAQERAASTIKQQLGRHDRALFSVFNVIHRVELFSVDARGAQGGDGRP